MARTAAERWFPRYRSHNEVWAVRIAAIEILEDGSAKIAPADPGFEPFTTGPGYGERFKGSEEDLGYYVVYVDGYSSWSPTKAFEDGYTRVGVPGVSAMLSNRTDGYGRPVGRLGGGEG